MECGQAAEHCTKDASSQVEEMGDSEDGFEATSLCRCDDDDDRESCNDFVLGAEGGDVENREEEKMTWEMWLQMERSMMMKEIETDDSISCSNIDGEADDDEEDNRLFWEACLASGY